MKGIKNQYTILLKRLLLLLAIYSLLRLLFYIFNHSYFDLKEIDALVVFIAGLRFDLVAITITNILFIIMHLFPLKAFYAKWYQNILSFLFYVLNGIAIIFNCVDFAYFNFILKRSGADLLNVLMLGEDTGNNIGAMAADFWHVPVLAFIIITMMIFFYRKIKIKPIETSPKEKLIGWAMIIPMSALVLTAFRGGIQYKPLRIITAAEYSSPQNAPLILNTTFTIIKTYDKSGVEEKHFFTDAESDKIFNPVHQYHSTEPFRNLNVVLIILESFGKEYFGAYNKYKGYTPFLDSLIGKSLTFEYSFANSKRSIEGIPAVLASIPNLMNEPFITSVYDGNKINSFAGLLKKKGYSTAFFHGGNNGTMGFDNFTAAAGYDKYYGRNEYGKGDYDGNWGVYDEPFYRFFVSKINAMKQPFHTAIFSLSSHHPYSIPPQYKNKFPKGTLPIHESIGYADYALKTFFENASRQPWFDSTL
ncbi:MAG: sulfatase-like hydrolase/transferase, partial [Bacteroidia bacterium]